MAKDDGIDNTETDDAVVDDVAAKAAEIGKDLGVTKETIPDYDIQEETDDRIAKSREGAPATQQKKDRRDLSNKEKRDLRKQRVREKFGEKDALIAEQQRRLEEMGGRLAAVEGRLSGVDRGQVKTALVDSVRAFEGLEQQHAEAFKDGDGIRATKIMREMYTAQKRIEELQSLDKRLESAPQRPQQAPQFDAAVTSYAKQWASRNAWFKQDAGGNALDEDSEIAMALSARLVKEGYDPKSQDFWDELDDRAQKRLPHTIESKHDDDDDFEEEDKPVAQPQPRRRAAPPVGGSANRGDIKGKVAVNVSTVFLDELKRNGLYDDPDTRNGMIHEYLRLRKENPDPR